MVECSVPIDIFYFIWCEFDVPNWLTLAVEVAVAIFLGIIFLKKGRELSEESDKLK